MAMKLSEFDGDETEKVLGKVLTDGETSLGESLYVSIPRFDKSRRTDGGAKDIGGGQVEFEGDIEDYDRGDYITLTFEPQRFGGKHTLSRVEPAVFTDPLNADEPKFQNTDIPKTCPKCGREAAAVVETKYNSMTGGTISDTADACVVSADNRGPWFGITTETTFVHGTQ